MTLFSVAKMPVFCDAVGHRLEKRKNQDVKVIDLALRVQPFTAQHAAALDQDAYAFVKRILFKVNSGDPIGDLKAVEFKAPSESQKLIVFASPDTIEPSIAFDQVKVTKIRARTEKGVDGWALLVYVTFGPVGRSELEFVNAFYTEQRFITFEEGEPFLSFEDDGAGDGESDKDVEARRPAAPMWDDEPTPATTEAKRNVDTARKPMRRHKDPKHAAKAKQKAGRARA